MPNNALTISGWFWRRRRRAAAAAEFGGGGRVRLCHVPFDAAVEQFYEVELGWVAGQEVHLNGVNAFGQPVAYHDPAVYDRVHRVLRPSGLLAHHLCESWQAFECPGNHSEGRLR